MKHASDFTEDGLQWVVNAYTVTFAGFLLLGGRAADLLGRRSVFVFGLVLFSLASLAGGLADSRHAADRRARWSRALAARSSRRPRSRSSPARSRKPAERNRAVGIWGAMGGAGGAAGVLLGGIITDAAELALDLLRQPADRPGRGASSRSGCCSRAATSTPTRNFDFARRAHRDPRPLGARVRNRPHRQLRLGRSRRRCSRSASASRCCSSSCARGPDRQGAADAAAALPLAAALAPPTWSAAASAASTFAMWFFLSLYLQDVLGYSPIKTGLVFLPMTLCDRRRLDDRLTRSRSASAPSALLVVGMAGAGHRPGAG